MIRKAVFFDVGNTLVSCYHKDAFGPVLENCVVNAIAYLGDQGLIFEPAVVLQSAWQYNVEREDLKVTPLEDRLAALFSLRTPNHPMMPGLVRAFMTPVLAMTQASPGARQTLAALKSEGLVTGIISNTPWGSPRTMWSAQLDKLGLAEHIDHQVFCMDAGVRKPHPDIFRHMFAQSGVTAGESLFVGDDPVWDVAGAREVGMEVWLFAPEEVIDRPAEVPVVRSLAEVATNLSR